MALDTLRAHDESLELAVLTAESESVYPLVPGASLVVGRAPGSNIFIDDASVSRRHAIVHVAADGVRVEDLGGPNGVTVREAALSDDVSETHELVKVSRRTVAVGIGQCVNFGSVMTVVRQRPAREAADDVVMVDAVTRALYQQADLAAQGTISVLIVGETGAGKEIVAARVHARSPRASKPFLAINCAALSESLLESELFGHEKGAFTDAVSARAGLFESAEGGTMFLDEIGEMPMTTQVKLLRVLEERKVMRVGGRTPRSIDVRFVAATNRDLEGDAERGAFRQDLYFRLAGITLALPPLRERTAEIPPLARLFVERARTQLARRAPIALSDAALAAMVRYRWPGNIRELRNVVDRAVVLCSGATLLPEHLPPKLLFPPTSTPPTTGGKDGRVRLRDEIDSIERVSIEAALKETGGNQTLAA